MPTAQLCFFVLGMFLANAVHRSPMKRPQILFGASVLTMLALPYFVKAFTLQLYLSYFLLAAIVYSYASLDRPSVIKMVLGFAGLTSYSIYLLHVPVIELTKQIDLVSSPLKLVGMLCVLFSVCFLTYRYIELPGIRYGHRWSHKFLSLHRGHVVKPVVD
jgi:peptidoglycan/LPS O-acetylase OafA/YrhL